MAGNGRKNADDALILALATGQSVQDAARVCCISERTVYRRLDDPDFKRRIQSARGDMIGKALGRVSDGMSEAADVLRALLKADSENVRLGSCRALLELGVKLRESVELEARLEAIEQKQAEGKPA